MAELSCVAVSLRCWMMAVFIMEFVGLPGTQGKELCYIDQQTHNEVYCETECCSNVPLQCCDKTNFVIQCSVVGGIGGAMLVAFLTCMLYRRRLARRKKQAAEEASRRKVPPANSVSPSSSPALSKAAAADLKGGEETALSHKVDGSADSVQVEPSTVSYGAVDQLKAKGQVVDQVVVQMPAEPTHPDEQKPPSSSAL